MDHDRLDTRGFGIRFHLDEDARVLLATVEPIAGAGPVDEAWLSERLNSEGFGELRLATTATGVLIQQYNAGRAVAALPIAERVDASLNLNIADDGLSATLEISPAQGGARLAKETVLAELAAKGIIEGIDLDALNGAIAAGAAAGIVIARGRPAQAGADGYLESLISEVRDRSPRLCESGQVDYRDLGEILVVAPGDALMQRHPPTAGVAGVTVLGEPIAPQPGKNVLFAAGLSGAEPAADDPDRLLATLAGQPVQVRGGMMVEPVYALDAVTMASGNVRFDGSVKIRGDVAAGMTVSATGDIEIGGVAESSMLEAGGSIVIKGGAIGRLGRKDGGAHRIQCDGSFSAAYAQQVRVEAGDSIFIDDIAMQCDLSAANHIRVGDRRRGHVIGGRLQATLSIRAKVLGSPNRIETHLEVGTSPELHKQQLALAKERDGKETQLLDLSKLLSFANQHPGRLAPEMLARARQTAAQLSENIAELRAVEQGLTQKIELAHEARVIAEQAMYEGVIVTLGNQRFRVAGEHGGGVVGLGGHGLELLPQP